MSKKPTTKTAAPGGACAVPPPSYNKTDGALKGNAIMSEDAWKIEIGRFSRTDNHLGPMKITYAFIKTFGYTENRERAVETTISAERVRVLQKGYQHDTWEDWANICFKSVQDLKVADIRIAFEPGSSWSAVGQAASRIAEDKPTLNLGWLKDSVGVSPEDRGTILHEFGHALGLMHEHQSPARGQFIHLKELEVYRYYEPLLGDRATVKSQIIDTFNEGKIMNMSTFDMKSIMMYFMPAFLNEEGVNIPVNVHLSTLDKAFIMLNYPPDLSIPEKFELFMQAMIDAGVTNRAAGEILHAFQHPEKEDNEDEQVARYKTMRAVFSQYNKRTTVLRSANSKLLNSIDPSTFAQFGIKDVLGNVVKNKLFQSIVKNVVNNTLLQNGIPVRQSIPGADRIEVANMIGGLVTHPLLGEYVTSYHRDLGDWEPVQNAVVGRVMN